MGLDSYVATKKPSGEFEIRLPDEIRELFKNVNTSRTVAHACGKTVSFWGKAYNDIIHLVTRQSCSLYKDLETKDCLFIYRKLDEYLNEYGNIVKHLDDFTKTEWDHQTHLENWFDRLFDMYHPSYDELCSLRDILKICAENNLYLYASR